MKAKGNGTVGQCVNNLLSMYRGECPFERLKGLDAALIDRPSSIAGDQWKADAQWLIETYEPRADIDHIELQQQDTPAGNFKLLAIITANSQG